MTKVPLTIADAPSDDDLDALVRRVDPDRWLASRFVADVQARADVIAVYAFDHELARAPRAASNPLVAEMRLAWWREVLDEVFEGRPVRRHPAAQALAQAVVRRALSRTRLEAMIDARYRELDPEPMSSEDALEWARGTAGEAAAVCALVLDPAADPSPARAAGAAWSLARLGRSDLAAAVQAERRAARGFAPAVFPAAAPAALARAYAAGRKPGDLAKRLILTWAVLRGRV